MPTTIYNVTLNGVTNFQDVQGNTYSWGGGKYIGYGNFVQDNGNILDADFGLAGSNWSLEYFHVWSAGGGLFSVTDLDGGNRFIRHMYFSDDTVVSLNTTNVGNIEVQGNADITFGVAGAAHVIARGEQNRIETGSGFVGSIETRGVDTVHVYGGANSVKTGDQNDQIGLFGGFTGLVEGGSGNDLFGTVGGGGGRVDLSSGADTAYLLSDFLDLLNMGSDNDKVIADGGNAGQVYLGDGNDTITVKGGSRIDSVDAGQGNVTVTVAAGSRIEHLSAWGGTQVITVQGNGRIREIVGDESTVTITTGTESTNEIDFWRCNTTINIGAGGAGSVGLYSDQAQAHVLTSAGWVRSIEVGDDQTMNLTLSNQGGGRVTLGDLSDRVLVQNGAGVDVVDTRDGNDDVRILNGGYVETLDVGNGSDTIRFAGSGAHTVRLESGNDTLTLTGDSNIRTVDAFQGNKTIVVSDNARISTLELSEATANIKVEDLDSRIRAIKLYESNSTLVTEGFHEMVYSWRGTQNITVGQEGGIAAMTFYSDFNVTQTIAVNGWAGAIQMGQFVQGKIVVKGDVDTITLSERDDTIDARGGVVDYITAGSGNDTIFGSDGDEIILGGDGNDWLRGGKGNDEASGGAGADTFVFFVGDGKYLISDFQAGVDELAIGGAGAGFTVQALQPYISQDGNDLVIGAGTQEVRLVNVQLNELAPGDILII